MQRYRIVVRGLVQGVFYRASTRERAAALGLAGWVVNRADGSVLIEAQGPAEALDALVAWCRQGPTDARVDDVEVAVIPAVVDAKRFEIHR